MAASELSGMVVLIVDDQRPFQVMLKGILLSLGIEQIHLANQGEHALNLCSLYPYDVLFVDYNLGSGKNGRQLLIDLRQRKLLQPQSIFMIVTGENTVSMVMSAVELEPDDYLMKPFSQSLLKSRLLKLAQKKRELADLYQAMFAEQQAPLIEICQQHIHNHGRYEQFCRRVLAETYLKQHNFTALEPLLRDTRQVRTANWTLVLEAKFRLLQQDYPACLALTAEAITLNKLCAPAYDLQASCYLEMGDADAAAASIQRALAIAPYYLPRQFLSLQVARAAGLPQNMVTASKQIFEQTRKTSQQDVTHLCNYIRTLLEAIGVTTEAHKKNRLQQETLLLLQRSKHDAQLSEALDFDRFEQLCLARMEALDGRLQQAKRTAGRYHADFTATDVDLPDLIMLQLSLGEFEEAASWLQAMPNESRQEPVLAGLLQQQQSNVAETQRQLADLNKTGIALYQENKLMEAIVVFEQALQVAPANTGAALNLIQAMLQMLESQQKQKSVALYQRCRKVFRLIDPKQLPDKYRDRYQQLDAQYQQFKKELKQHH